MDKQLLSVGLDVGTTTTQLVFSRLEVQNRGSAFTVPRMEITGRQILYKSPIHFTPLLGGELIDGEALGQLVDAEYQRAGIRREDVDTGAVIITGETSRKENAEAVVRNLSDFAGDFVVATAGPDLESALAARGAGAVEASEQNPVLHMDIGGGTANLALCRDGKILSTGCLNVGGRLIKFDDRHRITYVSPVLQGKISFSIGDMLTEHASEEIAGLLASILEMAAGLREKTPALGGFLTAGTSLPAVPEGTVPSFSGGVADCIDREVPWDAYGDLGPALGKAIRRSALCREPYRLGSETIRATVIGAGCHSTQLSGSTVFHRNIAFPLKNLPVLPVPSDNIPIFLSGELSKQETIPVLALPPMAQDYPTLTALADALSALPHRGPWLLAMEQDMAKALGQALALRLPKETPILCIDRVRLNADNYLDVGAPIGPALPLVVKTIVFNR